MTSFQLVTLLAALYSFQVDALNLRSLVENPLLPAHRRLASCPTTDGVDYLGNNIDHVSGVPVWQCCTLCSQTPNCGAFTWTNYAGGTCWLKTAKGNTAANAAAVSAELVPDVPDCPLTDNVDYHDHDIANVRSNDAGACCSICATWPGCHAFTWSNHNGGTCWLKSEKGTVINKTGVKSAEVTNIVEACKLQKNVDFVDNDIANTPGKTPGHCCGICHNWSGCRSFSWSNYNGGTCWLKSAKGQTVTKNGVVSSQLLDNPTVDCVLETNVDYVNEDIGNVPGWNPQDCCQKCRNKVGCHAFSWSSYKAGTCWLKGRKGSTITKNGVTSAVVF